MLFWIISSIFCLYKIYNKCKKITDLGEIHYNELKKINPKNKTLIIKTKEKQINEIFYVILFIIMYLSFLIVCVINARIL